MENANDIREQLEYRYQNAPIPGGGYVTGFVFEPAVKGMLYLRTDIGGAYRFDPQDQRWKSLCDSVTAEDKAVTYPIAIAVNPRRPGMLYVASGDWREEHGWFSVSEDYGKHFRRFALPMKVHGNLPGRGTGYRLILDRQKDDILYFASQTSGLWRTRNAGETWEKLSGMRENFLTFVGQSDDGTVLFVGAAGVTEQKEHMEAGPALYASKDGGETFETLWQPEYHGPRVNLLMGPVAQRYATDDQYLYVTYAGRCEAFFMPELGYSCDAGKVTDGHVVRYDLSTFEAKDITPAMEEKSIPDHPGASEACLHLGYSGIDVCRKQPGLVVCTTIRKNGGNSIYRSMDHGETWTEILHDLDIGRLVFRASYMQPRFNGNRSLIHWMTDFKIDPCDPEKAWFNTGTGVFRTGNLLDEIVTFSDWSDGIEETVHLNVYAPPKGEVLLIDILGDLGGFAFRDLTKACENSFADADGNRYITCLNADYSDLDPNLVAVTPRGNWTGLTKGGVILSKDNCKSFERLPMPFGLGDELDEALRQIERPNVNSGWIAMSPDGKKLVWSIAKWNRLPIGLVISSQDGGESFTPTRVYDLAGKEKKDGGIKVFSDRVNSNLFYGFGEKSQIYLSADCGKTFYQFPAEGLDQEINFSIVDSANPVEIRGESGRSGVFYFAAGAKGLWRMEVLQKDGNCLCKRLGDPKYLFYHVGLGLLREKGDYFTEEKALYVSANIGGRYGFYRSLDQGRSFQKLNHDWQCFGDVNSIDGDKRVFGRFFIGTGSRGVLYGEPAIEERKS
ncbi:MAG: endoglucanase [Lachnospiraceae bacterium]|jgi:photosystem II stability/assembly factor-like uncharacterized protein|nr:endoglucanase [Lachnospiraceae bacterium]